MPHLFADHANTNNFRRKKISSSFTKRFITLVLLCLLVISTTSQTQIVHSQSLQQQINNLNAQNNQKRAELNVLEVEAGNYKEALATLRAQIQAVQKEMKKHQLKRKKLVVQISKQQAKLDYEEKILGKNIRAMYLEGEMSTIEMLATSKDLSEYLDKKQYRDSLQAEINATMAKIQKIKAVLDEQKTRQDKLIAEQKDMQKQLNAQKKEQSRLLSMNETQQSRLDGQLQANSSRIAELRRQQAAANAQLWSGGGSYKISVPDSTGYPWANVQPFPNSYPDPWGMYKRQCVSYTAWKVYKDGKYMPYWGGRGNAKNWANNARAEGIPVHSTPKRGDIAVSTRGTYGHVMYVEHVYSNGTMRISQYNASWDGRYSEAIVSVYGLEYVRFR